VAQEIFTDEEAQENRATYLASIFRSVRFGTEDAHGRANAVQLNYLLAEGGIELDRKKGEFSVHPRKFDPAIAGLAKLLLEIEATGDYGRAGDLIQTYGRLDPAVQETLKRIEQVPVDVVFTYPL
ncbi:MAG: Zn-dependent hydrolase, partial [Acidobacteriota bacterium]